MTIITVVYETSYELWVDMYCITAAIASVRTCISNRLISKRVFTGQDHHYHNWCSPAYDVDERQHQFSWSHALRLSQHQQVDCYHHGEKKGSHCAKDGESSLCYTEWVTVAHVGWNSYSIFIFSEESFVVCKESYKVRGSDDDVSH